MLLHIFAVIMMSQKTIAPGILTILLLGILMILKQSSYSAYKMPPESKTIIAAAKQAIGALPDSELRLDFYSILDELKISYLKSQSGRPQSWHVQNLNMTIHDFGIGESEGFQKIDDKIYLLIRRDSDLDVETFLFSVDALCGYPTGTLALDRLGHNLVLNREGTYGQYSPLIVLLYVLCNVCLLLFVVQFGIVLFQNSSVWTGVLLTAFGLVLCRWILSNGSLALSNFYYSSLLANLGEYFIDALFLCVWAQLVSRNVPTYMEPINRKKLIPFVTIALATVSLLYLYVYSFERVSALLAALLEQEAIGVMTVLEYGWMLGVLFTFCLVTASLFLLIFVLVRISKSVPLVHRLMALVLALFLIGLALMANHSPIPFGAFALGTSCILVLMDLFLDSRTRSATWKLIWMGVLALFNTIICALVLGETELLTIGGWTWFSLFFVTGLLAYGFIMSLDLWFQVIPDQFIRLRTGFPTYYLRMEATIFLGLAIFFMIIVALSHGVIWRAENSTSQNQLKLYARDHSGRGPERLMLTHQDMGFDVAWYNESLFLSADFKDYFFPTSTFVMEEAHRESTAYNYLNFQGRSKFERAYVKLSQQSQANQRLESWRLLFALLNGTVIIFFLAFVLSLGILRYVSQPLIAMRNEVNKLGTGSTRLIEWGDDDEIGLLIKKYNSMIIELERTADQLIKTEREDAWREMAKQVAHEIKNPLTPMKLSLQYLESRIDNIDDEEEARNIVQTVSRTLIEQIENLSNIANSFSNFARMPHPQFERTNLNELLANVHNLYENIDDADFNLYTPIDDIYVWADRNHLLQVLNNLVKNAIQAIPDSRDGRVDIRLYEQDADAIIEVADNGVGIPQEKQNKVFSPNFTTKNSGTGLGLAISYKIVHAHNGNIYFKTREQMGTSFYIQLSKLTEE